MSIIEPKTLTLRDGACVKLRSPAEDDAPRLLAYIDAVRRETTGILFAPEDELPTLEWERNWIRGNREKTGIQIMAEDEAGNMIALCSAGSDARYRIRHRADIGISVRAAWCERGLGTLLMKELVAWARAEPSVEVLTLGVYADNPRALRVYEKVGFTRDGERRWHVKRDGQFVNEVMMSCWVGEQPRIDRLVLPIDERTHLRLVEPADAEAFYEVVIRNREHVKPWLEWVPSVKSLDEVRSAIARARERYIKDGSTTMLILHDGRIVGQVYHLRMDRRIGSVELGYWLDLDHRGRGLMTAAVRAMTAHSFDALGLHRVWLKAGATNTPSRGVAERAGFELDGVMRQSYRFDSGELIDVAYYSTLKPDAAAATGKTQAIPEGAI